GLHPHLRSFPTRRSSDLSFAATNAAISPIGVLPPAPVLVWADIGVVNVLTWLEKQPQIGRGQIMKRRTRRFGSTAVRNLRFGDRSEEHTSELQSRRDLVC